MARCVRIKLRLVLALLVVLAHVGATVRVEAQPAAPSLRSLAVRLGFPDTARLLILHADDLGITPGVDRATIAALASGAVSSASIIAPSPSLTTTAGALARAGQFDLGVHLTLTSETAFMRRRPSAAAGRVPSLVDGEGVFPVIISPAAQPDEVERELEAQIDAVRAAGINITHLDSHQFILYTSGKAVFEAFRRVARRACLPMLVPRGLMSQAPYLRAAIEDGQVLVNDVVSIDPSVPPAEWTAFYERTVKGLAPGLAELIVHLGEDTPDERAAFRGLAGWGADWRERDRQVIASPAFRALLEREGIRVVTWGEVARVAGPCVKR